MTYPKNWTVTKILLKSLVAVQLWCTSNAEGFTWHVTCPVIIWYNITKLFRLRLRTMPFDSDTRLSISLPKSFFLNRFSLFCFLPNIVLFLSSVVLSCLVCGLNPKPKHVPFLFSLVAFGLRTLCAQPP